MRAKEIKHILKHEFERDKNSRNALYNLHPNLYAFLFQNVSW